MRTGFNFGEGATGADALWRFITNPVVLGVLIIGIGGGYALSQTELGNVLQK